MGKNSPGMLNLAYRRHKGKCFYCKEEVVMIRAVRHAIIKQTDNRVEYEIDGQIYVAKIASADHIVDRELGGTNHQKNIALACRRCNNLKEVMKLKLVKDSDKLSLYLGRVRSGIIKW